MGSSDKDTCNSFKYRNREERFIYPGLYRLGLISVLFLFPMPELALVKKMYVSHQTTFCNVHQQVYVMECCEAIQVKPICLEKKASCQRIYVPLYKNKTFG